MRRASVACPLVWGVSKKALRKNANGTTEMQKHSSMPRTTPKLAPLNSPPVDMIAQVKDMMKPKMTPSERK